MCYQKEKKGNSQEGLLRFEISQWTEAITSLKISSMRLLIGVRTEKTRCFISTPRGGSSSPWILWNCRQNNEPLSQWHCCFCSYLIWNKHFLNLSSASSLCSRVRWLKGSVLVLRYSYHSEFRYQNTCSFPSLYPVLYNVFQCLQVPILTIAGHWLKEEKRCSCLKKVSLILHIGLWCFFHAEVVKGCIRRVISILTALSLWNYSVYKKSL